MVAGLRKVSECTFLSLPFPPVFSFLGKAVCDPLGRANGSHDVSLWYEYGRNCHAPTPLALLKRWMEEN